MLNGDPVDIEVLADLHFRDGSAFVSEGAESVVHAATAAGLILCGAATMRHPGA